MLNIFNRLTKGILNQPNKYMLYLNQRELEKERQFKIKQKEKAERKKRLEE